MFCKKTLTEWHLRKDKMNSQWGRLNMEDWSKREASRINSRYKANVRCVLSPGTMARWIALCRQPNCTKCNTLEEPQSEIQTSNS